MDYPKRKIKTELYNDNFQTGSVIVVILFFQIFILGILLATFCKVNELNEKIDNAPLYQNTVYMTYEPSEPLTTDEYSEEIFETIETEETQTYYDTLTEEAML